MNIGTRCDFYDIAKGPVEWAFSQVNGVIAIVLFAIIAGSLVAILAKAFNSSARRSILAGVLTSLGAGIMLALLFRNPSLITNMFGGC